MLCGECSLVNRGFDGIRAITMHCRAWTCPNYGNWSENRWQAARHWPASAGFSLGYPHTTGRVRRFPHGPLLLCPCPGVAIRPGEYEVITFAASRSSVEEPTSLVGQHHMAGFPFLRLPDMHGAALVGVEVGSP